MWGTDPHQATLGGPVCRGQSRLPEEENFGVRETEIGVEMENGDMSLDVWNSLGDTWICIRFFSILANETTQVVRIHSQGRYAYSQNYHWFITMSTETYVWSHYFSDNEYATSCLSFSLINYIQFAKISLMQNDIRKSWNNTLASLIC